MPLSTKQVEYLALAWQCFDTEPKIDYEKFKTVAGLASAASARELMRVTKKKLKEEYGALSGSIQSSNATPAKTPASKRKKAQDQDDDEAGESTPSKKAKKSPKEKKSSPVKKEMKADESDDGDFV